MNKVNIISYCLLLFFLFACKKGDGNEVSGGGGTTGIVRPVGESSGNVTETVIGAQGGELSTDDGSVLVAIPPGALSADVTVGIEAISRTLVDAPEQASKLAFRLTPHGQKFLKPIKLTVAFTNEEFAELNPDALSIAYQDEKGRWKGLGNVQTDKAAKTVSVETVHFSDWTTYEIIYLTPKADFSVEVGESAMLQVMTVLPLVSLTTGEYMNTEEFYLDEPSRIKLPVDWRIVNGPGNGTITGVPTAASAMFKAPAVVPASNNPAMVEATLNLGRAGVMLLFRNIQLVETIKPGIHLQIDGGDWIHFDEEFFTNGSSVRSQGDYPFDRHEIALTIDGEKAKGVGTWAWSGTSTSSDHITSFEYIVKTPAPFTHYQAHYGPPCPLSGQSISPGFVSIRKVVPDGTGSNWFIGELLVTQSMPFVDNNPCYNKKHRLHGVFKLRMK